MESSPSPVPEQVGTETTASSSPQPAPQGAAAKPGGWVKFEDESGSGRAEELAPSDAAAATPKRLVRPRPEDFSPVPISEQERGDRPNQAVAAVISAETTHVNVSRSSVSRSPAKPIDTKVDLHTVSLRETNGASSANNASSSIIRQGFGKN